MSLLLVLSLGAGAQEDESLQTYLREVMTAEDVESSTWEDVYDQLCYLSSTSTPPRVPNWRSYPSSLPSRSRRSWTISTTTVR